MKLIYNATYLAITLHFAEKVLKKLEPSPRLYYIVSRLLNKTKPDDYILCVVYRLAGMGEYTDPLISFSASERRLSPNDLRKLANILRESRQCYPFPATKVYLDGFRYLHKGSPSLDRFLDAKAEIPGFDRRFLGDLHRVLAKMLYHIKNSGTTPG